MRLKSFQAKTMAQAMKLVRDTLGEDAIIISSREEDGQVRLTAALEQDSDIAFNVNTQNSENDAWLQYDQESDSEDAIAEEVTDVLLKHAVPAEIIDMVSSTALGMGLSTPRIALMAALEHMYSFRTLGHQKPIMMLGLPGAGKTLAVAKYATQAIVNDRSVAVITADTKRAGGVQQLEAFTKLLGADLIKVRKPEELKEQLSALSDKDQILIDMPGINPFDVQDMRDIARFVGVANVMPLLVLQTGLDSDESGEIAKAFSVLGVDTIMPTRLDMARRLGGVLAGAHYGGMAFAHGSHTEAVADGLTKITAESLADYFMPNKTGTQ